MILGLGFENCLSRKQPKDDDTDTEPPTPTENAVEEDKLSNTLAHSMSVVWEYIAHLMVIRILMMKDERSRWLTSPEEDKNKTRFLKVIRILKIVRIRHIKSLVPSLSSYDCSCVDGISNSAFAAWNPQRLQGARDSRRAELVRACFRGWFFVPNTAISHCTLCDRWLNIGQMPDHRNGKNHLRL